MKLTFEEYLDSYKDEPPWFPRPTLEEYNHICEVEMIAEFLGYSRKIVKFQTKTWNSSDEYYWDWTEGELWCDEHGDPIDEEYDTLNFHHWNELMEVVNKVRSYPSINSMTEGEISIPRFEIGRNGMFLEAYQYRENNSRGQHFYHKFIEGKPDESDCESYIETIYKTMADFIKWINEGK